MKNVPPTWVSVHRERERTQPAVRPCEESAGRAGAVPPFNRGGEAPGLRPHGSRVFVAPGNGFQQFFMREMRI